MPSRDIVRMTLTAVVSSGRPIPGCAESRLVGVMPGWERLLRMPQPAASDRRCSSIAKRPNAIFDELYAFIGSYVVLPVEVVPVDRALVGRDAHLAGHVRASCTQQRQQASDEREVAEVVGRELQLESVVGQLPRRRVHHSGIVDQDVDGPPLAARALGERCDRLERRQIERADADDGIRRPLADARGSGLALLELRTGMRMSAPARASRAAISNPTPSLAPVTRACLPVRSGTGMSRIFGMRAAPCSRGCLHRSGERCGRFRARSPRDRRSLDVVASGACAPSGSPRRSTGQPRFSRTMKRFDLLWKAG